MVQFAMAERKASEVVIIISPKRGEMLGNVRKKCFSNSDKARMLLNK